MVKKPMPSGEKTYGGTTPGIVVERKSTVLRRTSIRIIVLIGLAVALILAVQQFNPSTLPDTGFEAHLRHEAPVGSTPEAVESALDRLGVQHSAYSKQSHQIDAIRRNTRVSLWTAESEVITLRFDSNHRLATITIARRYSGP
jgi:hypothetical protein